MHMSSPFKLSQLVNDSKLVINVVDTFDFGSDAYRILFGNADVTAFQNPVWLGQFYQKMLVSRKARPRIVLGFDIESETLIFVLPLISRQMFGVTLLESTDLGVSDYAVPIVHSDYTYNLKSDLTLHDKIAEALGTYDILRVKPIRSEHTQLWQLFFGGQVQQLGFQSHASYMSSDYEVWRAAAFGKSQVKYIDRRLRKFERHGQVEISTISSGDISNALSFLVDARAGRFDGDPIQQPPVEDFYRAVAERGVESGYCRLYQLTCDSTRVGVIFGTCHAGRYYYLLIGCDYTQFGKFSPGLIMYDHIMRDWSAAGGDVFDFTIGDEAFKKDFGSKPTNMFELLNANSLLGKLAASAYRLKQSQGN